MSITAVDNTFVDSINYSSSSTSPIATGRADHDAYCLMIAAAGNLMSLKKSARKVSNETNLQF
jgi:hypothetical protein